MPIPGYLEGKLANFFQPWEYTKVLTALVDPSTTDIAPKKTGYRVRVVDIIATISTSAGVTLTVQDDAGAPVVLHHLAALTAAGTYDTHYGDRGIPATVSCALDLVASGAGYAGVIHMEGYYEPIGPLTPAQV